MHMLTADWRTLVSSRHSLVLSLDLLTVRGSSRSPVLCAKVDSSPRSSRWNFSLPLSCLSGNKKLRTSGSDLTQGHRDTGANCLTSPVGSKVGVTLLVLLSGALTELCVAQVKCLDSDLI